ncbi:hypothetical protein FHW19_004178 [Ochrobactrum anthropi]|nr:hypothetical protein [Brucella anthropi]
MPHKARSKRLIKHLQSSQAATQILEGQISIHMRTVERVLWGSVGFLLCAAVTLVLIFVSRF